MNFTFEPISKNDSQEIVDLFNYYVENSFAAYPERPIPLEFFKRMLAMSDGYPTVAVRGDGGEFLGFGLLRPYNPLPTFRRAAEIAYFLKPETTGQGLGKAVLDFLTEKAKEKGIAVILASVSSLNPGSIRFHQKNGFKECARFEQIGCKNETIFDVVYLHKLI